MCACEDRETGPGLALTIRFRACLPVNVTVAEGFHGLSPMWEVKPPTRNQETRDLSVVLPPTWRALGKIELP